MERRTCDVLLGGRLIFSFYERLDNSNNAGRKDVVEYLVLDIKPMSSNKDLLKKDRMKNSALIKRCR